MTPIFGTAGAGVWPAAGRATNAANDTIPQNFIPSPCPDRSIREGTAGSRFTKPERISEGRPDREVKSALAFLEAPDREPELIERLDRMQVPRIDESQRRLEDGKNQPHFEPNRGADVAESDVFMLDPGITRVQEGKQFDRPELREDIFDIDDRVLVAPQNSLLLVDEDP